MSAENVQKKITSYFGRAESVSLVQVEEKKEGNIYMRALSRKLKTVRDVVPNGGDATSDIEESEKVFSRTAS